MLNTHQKKKIRKKDNGKLSNRCTRKNWCTPKKKKEAFKIKDARHYQNKRPTIKQMLKTLNCII